jgi:transglutaminase-like putative cysteine protease
MAIRVALHHKTSYQFDRLVNLSPHEVRLRPAAHARTPILSYSLTVNPEKHFINWQQDPYGNYSARYVFPEMVRSLDFTVDLVADMTVINPFDFFVEKYAEFYPFNYTEQQTLELSAYLKADPVGVLLGKWLEDAKKAIIQSELGIANFMVAINQRLQQDIGYLVRMEPGVQTPEQTLTLASGSCRDSAWLLVQLMRRLGVAARLASGYLVQLSADQKSLDGPSGPESDFTDLHAWAEIYLPGAGWVGLDPTSGLLCGEGHLPVACTPDPSSAAPISGMVDDAECEFEFAMTVQRMVEDPRTTKPYTDDQWNRIQALGDSVDEQLNRDDVRLTFGGEPTFVSMDDMEGPEWNSAAVGPTKRCLSGKLVKRLRNRFAPGAMLHYGEGKYR